MKCSTEGCTADAVAALQFPWPSEPTAACAEHVKAAQQLMSNLGRENELRMQPIEQDAPATPRDPPAAARQVIETHAVDDGRTKVLELELELERERTKRAELLARIVDAAFDRGAQLWDRLKTEAPELMQKFAEQYAAATGAFFDEGKLVRQGAAGAGELEHVEGTTEPASLEPPPEPQPSEASSPSPA